MSEKTVINSGFGNGIRTRVTVEDGKIVGDGIEFQLEAGKKYQFLTRKALGNLMDKYAEVAEGMIVE